MPLTGRRAGPASCALPTSPARRSGSRRSPGGSSRASSPSWARPRTRASSASARPTACRNGDWALRRSSSFRPRRRPMPPCRGTSGWVGSRHCETSSVSEPRLRDAVRAVLLDNEDRALLVRFEFPHWTGWATPGGGVHAGETDEEALRRELAEETGLTELVLGPVVWTRTHLFELA